MSITTDPNQDGFKDKLAVLKEAWDKQWQRNDNLDSKATSIIQVAGTITALIFGFVTFSQSVTESTFIPPIQALIISSIFLGLGSIILSILAIRTRSFFFPIDSSRYFENADFKIGKGFNPDSVRFHDEMVKSAWDYENIFKHYLISLRTFQRNSESKSRFVFAAVLFLVIGVALTVTAVTTIFWWQSLPPQQEETGLTCKELTTSGTRTMNSNNIISSSLSNDDSKVMLCTTE
jgi:hypothetical protein